MTLGAGTRLGPYEVVAALGAGGMGEVLRARDTKLGREVAIKVLPAAFAQDAERVARFRREAQILASLNHPNIACIHGLEESDGHLALVMELVEGEDLASRLKRGAIPVDEAVPIARQIAEALEEAHERGIVHRDLKPANIKVTAEVKVKVLDFGLAKAFAADSMSQSGGHDLSQSPTLATAAGTQAGVILGTAAYMSPEQARGKAVDKRADIWAFGVLLFEMLAGQRLFRGDTASDTLAAVLREEIPWSALPAATPQAVVRLLRRCLDRDPKQRLRDVGEARLALGAGPETAGAALDSGTPAPSRGTWWAWALGGLAIGAVVATSLATRSPAPGSVPQPLRLLAIATAARPPNASQAISPDGRFVAYTAGDRLWIRNLAALEAREVAGSQGAHLPFWSPRSDAVAFAVDGALVKVRVDGDKLEEVCRFASGRFGGGAWSEAQGIVFAVSRANWDGELLQVDAGGGQPRPFARPDPERRERRLTHPSFLPDGRTLLYTVVTRDANTGEVAVDQGGVRTLLGLGDQSTEPTWSPTGHILFSRGRPPRTSLWALPFSLSTLKATGEPFRIAASGSRATASATGSLLFGLPRPEPQQLVWVDRAGRLEGGLGEPIDSNLQVPSLSSDGRRAAATVDWRGVMVWDTERGVASTLGGDQGVAQPELSPDGERVIFARPGQGGIWIRRADGSDEPTLLVRKEASVGGHFSSDGAWLAFYVVDPKTLRDLWAVDLTKPDQPFELLRTPANEALPRISPDGKLVAYQSDASGRWEVYVQPFPRGEGRWQVSSGGGQNPLWNPRGGELFFVSGDDLMVAPISTTGSSAGMNPALVPQGLRREQTSSAPAPPWPQVSVGKAARLFSGSAAGSRLVEPTYVERHYAVAPDGRRFLLVKGSGQGRSDLVLADGDWRRAPTGAER